MQNLDLDVQPATAPGVEVIFSSVEQPSVGSCDGDGRRRVCHSPWLISEVEMMVATEGCIASGKAEAAETKPWKICLASKNYLSYHCCMKQTFSRKRQCGRKRTRVDAKLTSLVKADAAGRIT